MSYTLDPYEGAPQEPDPFSEGVKLGIRMHTKQWQPIESAPKDGTEIIVYHPEAGVCAAFSPGEGCAWYCLDGWNLTKDRRTGHDKVRITSFDDPPTHWQPLPPPPETQK